MTQPSINPHGAIDLSVLAKKPASSPAGPGSTSAVPTVVDVTEEDFQAVVLDQSMTVPVVIDFWAEWCGPCKQLSPILEKLAEDDGGKWLLAKVDVDANPRLGAAFQVQSIPAVFAVIGGQLLPLFQGALPAPEVRQYLDELLRVAEQNGVSGRLSTASADPAESEPEPEPGLDARYDEAFEAIERGDLEAASKAYRELLDQTPGDAEAAAGLAQVELLRRTSDVDAEAVLTAAEQSPDDVAAQIAAADVEMRAGREEAAFNRLIEVVRRTRDDERSQAREHLLKLFELLGSSDARVAKARVALANALF